MQTLTHPHRTKSNCVPYHRWVVEQDIGRYLEPVVRYKSGKKKGKIKKPGELVHHIDMDKRNNDISNLMICKGMAHHQNVHATYNDICKVLMDKKIVIFDEKNGYQINKELIK
jgi:hypothetical protein